MEHEVEVGVVDIRGGILGLSYAKTPDGIDNCKFSFFPIRIPKP